MAEFVVQAINCSVISSPKLIKGKSWHLTVIKHWQICITIITSLKCTTAQLKIWRSSRREPQKSLDDCTNFDGWLKNEKEPGPRQKESWDEWCWQCWSVLQRASTWSESVWIPLKNPIECTWNDPDFIWFDQICIAHQRHQGHCQGCSIRIRAVLGEVRTPTKRVLSRSYFMPQRRNQGICCFPGRVEGIEGNNPTACCCHRSETFCCESEKKIIKKESQNVRESQRMSENVRECQVVHLCQSSSRLTYWRL